MNASEITGEEAKGCFAQLLGFPFIAAYVTFVDGWVLSKLWLWHAVPLGFRALHWHTCAVGVLAYMLLRNGRPRYKDDRPSHEQALHVVAALLFPWVALLLAWWWS